MNSLKHDLKDAIRPILQRAVTEHRDRRLSVNDIIGQVIEDVPVRMGLIHTGMVAILEEMILEDWARFANFELGERMP
jgi:hypothetical protein